MPEFENITHYLIGVKAVGKAKDKITRCYLANPIEIQSNNKRKNKTENHKKIKKEKNTQKKEENSNDKRLTMIERRAKYNELKRTMKEVWTTEMESDEDKKEIQSLPSHFKRYTVQERKIVVLDNPQGLCRTLENHMMG